MTRDDFLHEILEACSFYWWEVQGIYTHYEILAITPHFIEIHKIHWGFDDGYAEVLQFANNELLIDEMLNTL